MQLCVCGPVEGWCGVAVFESSVVDGHDLIGGFNHLGVDRALDGVLGRGIKERNGWWRGKERSEEKRGVSIEEEW